MKTRFLVLALLFAIGTAAVAQEAKPKFSPEKFVEKKVEMMQKSLMLDDKTAEKFASIYKEYLLEQAKCRPNIVRGKDLTDAQIKQNIEARMDAKQKALDVEKKYYGKLAKILNAKQLQKVFDKKEKAPMGGNKHFAPRGNKGKGFAPVPGPKCPRMNAPMPGQHFGKMGACKQGECAKDNCKKECNKENCKKADCPKAVKK